MHAAAVVHEVAPRAAIQQVSVAGSHVLRPQAICGAPASVARLASAELSPAALSLTELSLAALSLTALSLAASSSPEEPEPEDAPLPEVPWEPDALVSPDEAVPLAELPVLEEPELAVESEPSASELAVPDEPVAASSEPLWLAEDPLQPTATANPRAINKAETFRKADIEENSIMIRNL